MQASQVHPHQTLSSMSLWTLLCALVHGHVGTPNLTLDTMLSVQFSWQLPNPDSSIRLPDGEVPYIIYIVYINIFTSTWNLKKKC